MAAIKQSIKINCISELMICCILIPIKEMNPDFSNPLLINKTKATVTTAGCPNPEKASLDGINPNITNKDNIISETASYLNLPHINNPIKIIIKNEIIL
jgi:hypothetical protein